MKSRFTLSTVVKTVLAVLSVVLVTSVTFAQDVPHKVSYQGLLTDGTGNLVPDGIHVVKFTLYTDAAGTTPFWSDTFSLTTSKGIFNVILGGSGTVLPTPLNLPLWLGVAVENTAELRPLTQVVSAPYALGIVDSAVSTAKLQDGAVTANKMGQPFVGSVTLNHGQYTTDKGKDIDISVGTNLNLKVVKDANGQVQAIIDALGGGTLNEVRVAPNGGLIVTEQGVTYVTLAIGAQGVQSYMIKDHAVGNQQLADGSVDSRTILDGSVTGTDIASNTITSNNIKDGTIQGVDIAVPLVLTRATPGDVLDVDNTSNNIGGVPLVTFKGTGGSSDGTPVMLVQGSVVAGSVMNVVQTSTRSVALSATSAGGPALRGTTTQTLNVGAPDNPNAIEGIANTTVANAAGVAGIANAASANTQFGVTGATNTSATNSAGVMGTYTGTSGTSAGVWAAGGAGWGVRALSNTNSAVSAVTSGATNATVRATNSFAAGTAGQFDATGGGASTGVIVGSTLPAPATGVNIAATTTGATLSVTGGAGTTGVGVADALGTGVSVTSSATGVSVSGATATGVAVTNTVTAATGVNVQNTGATGISVSGQAVNGTGVSVTGATGTSTGVSVTNGNTGVSATGQAGSSFIGNNASALATDSLTNTTGSALTATNASTIATTAVIKNNAPAGTSASALSVTNTSGTIATSTFTNSAGTAAAGGGFSAITATNTSASGATIVASNAYTGVPVSQNGGVARFSNTNANGASQSTMTIGNALSPRATATNNYALVVTDGLVDLSSAFTTVLAPSIAAQLTIVTNPISGSTPTNGVLVTASNITGAAFRATPGTATNIGLDVSNINNTGAQINMSASNTGTGINVGNSIAPATGVQIKATTNGIMDTATANAGIAATLVATGTTGQSLVASNGASTAVTASITNTSTDPAAAGSLTVSGQTTKGTAGAINVSNSSSGQNAIYISGGNVKIDNTGNAGFINVNNNANSTFGLTSGNDNFSSPRAADATKVTVQGVASPYNSTNGQISSGGYELTVTGDANITGTLLSNNVTVSGTLKLANTANFDLTTSASPAINGFSTANQGIGVRGVNQPSTGSAPVGAGLVGIALDFAASNATLNLTAPTTGKAPFNQAGGVVGYVENPSYFGAIFANANISVVAPPAGAQATSVEVLARDTAATGRGIWVTQPLSGQTLTTGIEVGNITSSSRIKRGLFVNSTNGGTLDTGIVVGPAQYGVDVTAGTVAADDYGVRVRPTGYIAGQALSDGLVVEGVAAANAGNASIVRGLTIESDAATSMTHGAKIGFAPATGSNGNAPQNGVDARFNSAGSGRFGYRANTTVAGGAGVIAGDQSTANQLSEGAVLEASNVGVRIGSQFGETAGTATTGTGPATGLNATIANNGTGATVTTVSGGNTITTGYQVTNAAGGITTGVNVQTSGAAITTGVNVSSSGTLTTGFNATSGTGITTGANLVTTAGAIGNGVNIAPASGANVTSNGVNVSTAGAGTIGTGFNANSVNGTISAGVNVSTSGTGAVTTGVNVSSNNGVGTGANIVTTTGAIGNGVNIAPVSGANVTSNGVNVSTTGAGTINNGFNANSVNGTISTGVNVSTSGTGAVTTGVNVSSNNGVGTGANIVTTTGAIGNGVNIAPVSGANVTSNGVNVSTTGAGTINNGFNANSVNGTITNGFSVTTSGTGAITTGVNVNSNNGVGNGVSIATTAGGITNGAVVTPASNQSVSNSGFTVQTQGTGTIATGFSANSANGAITTGFNVSSTGATISTGVNISGTQVTNGVTIANVNSTGGVGYNANPSATGTSVGMTLGGTTPFNTGARVFANGNSSAAGNYSASTVGGIMGRNTNALSTGTGQTYGVAGLMPGGTSTFAQMTTASAPLSFGDFSAGVVGDGSAGSGNERPGVIAVTSSPISATNNNSNNRAGLEAYNTNGGIALAGYSSGIGFVGITSGTYATATGVEGRATSTTAGVGMVAGSHTTGATAGNTGGGIIGFNQLNATDLSGTVISRNLQSGTVAGVIGTNASAAAGTRIGVLGLDAVGSTPGIVAGNGNNPLVGVMGTTRGTGTLDAGVIGDGAAGSTGFRVIGVTTGTGLNASTVTSGTGVDLTGINSGTGVSMTSLTSGTGVNLGVSISSGNGVSGTVASGGTGSVVSATNASSTANSAAIKVSNTGSVDGINIQNSSTGFGLHAVNTSTGEAARFDINATTTTGVHISAATAGTITNLLELTQGGSATVTNAIKIDPVSVGILSTSLATGASFTVNGGVSGPTGVTTTVGGATGGTTTAYVGTANSTTGANQGATLNANGSNGGTNTGLTVNVANGTTNNGIIVNTGAGNDLTINEDAVGRNGSISINTNFPTAATPTANAVTIDQGNLVLGTEGASPKPGQITFQDNTSNANNGTLGVRNPLGGTRTWTLPDTSGTIGVIPTGASHFVYFEPTANQIGTAGARNLIAVQGLANTTGGVNIDLATTANTSGNPVAVNANVTSGASSTPAMLISGTAQSFGSGSAITTGLNVTSQTNGSTGTVTGASFTAKNLANANAPLVGLSATATNNSLTNSTSSTAIKVTSSAGLAANAYGTATTVSTTGGYAVGDSIVVSGGTTENIGISVVPSGTGSIGIRMGTSVATGGGLSAGVTGIEMHGATVGVNIQEMPGGGSSIGENITWKSAATAAGTGINVDMSNATGTAVGVAVTGQKSGTGVDVNLGSAAGGTVGVLTEQVGAASGVTASGVTSGVGISGVVAAGNSGTAVSADGGGTAGIAFVVPNGQVKATATAGNRWGDSFTVSTAGTTQSITNGVVQTSSTIVYSIESAGNPGTTWISKGRSGTTFTVNTTTALAVGDIIHYVVINH